MEAKNLRLHDWASTTQSELAAILMALRYINEHDASALIVSDSKSALLALNSLHPQHKLLTYEARYKMEKIRNKRRDVHLLWTPSHIGIVMNDRADDLARSACQKQNVECSFGLPLKLFKTALTQNSFQTLYDLRCNARSESCTVRHYDAVCTYIIPYGQYHSNSRLCDLVTARIRLGYRYLWQIRSGADRTMRSVSCRVCKMPYGHTLEHYILSCKAVEKYRPSDLDFIALCRYFTESGILSVILREFPLFANP